MRYDDIPEVLLYRVVKDGKVYDLEIVAKEIGVSLALAIKIAKMEGQFIVSQGPYSWQIKRRS